MPTLRRRSTLEKSPVVTLILVVLVVILVIVLTHRGKDTPIENAIPNPTNCLEMDTQLDEGNNDWQIMSPLAVGNCYNLDDNDKQALADAINTHRLETLITRINAEGQRMAASKIEAAIYQSLQTGVLNLIKN